MSINIGTIQTINLADIILDQRARKEMGNLDETENSMKKYGLLQPLVVQKISDNSYLLLAGGRRYAILKRNNIQQVHARIFLEKLSELEIKSIELAENVYRKDFEPHEHDALVSEIHTIHQKFHGVKLSGPNQKGWSMEDTSKLTGITKGAVSEAIKRAKAREQFPELFENCKTQKDATKIIQKMNETLVKNIMAEKIKNNNTNNTIANLSKSFIIKDFFEGVKDIPDEIMHLVEIDPPYAIDILKNKKNDESSHHYKLSSYNEIDKEEYQIFLAKLFAECYRVMTEHSWLVCWFAPEPWFEIVYQELNNAGFTTNRMCGMWNKGTGQNKWPEIYLSNSYEMFFYAWKGRPVINNARINVFNHQPIPAGQKIHETERPVELMKDIYNTFAFPRSRILIPFLGSGNGLIAAHQLDISAVGFELGRVYKDSFLVKLNNMEL